MTSKDTSNWSCYRAIANCPHHPLPNRGRVTQYHKCSSSFRYEDMTFDTFVRLHWWNDYILDGEHTPTTVAFYEYMREDLLLYFGTETLLGDIDAECVKRYIGFLRKDAKTKKGLPYSSSTIQHHYKCLVTILEYARRLHYIPSNPCDDLSPKEKPHRSPGVIDFLNALQAREFLYCLEAEPLYWRCMMNLLLTSGLRRGEAVGLQWRDIDSRKLTVSIQRNVTIDKNSPDKISIGKTKGKRTRTVPLSARVHALLMELKAEQAKQEEILRPEMFIFHRDNDPNKPLYPTEPTRWQRKFVIRHGTKNVSPHDLRHTAATLALEGGASIKEIQELLGHADPATTLRFYTGITEETLHQTVDSIERLLQQTRYTESRLTLPEADSQDLISAVTNLTNQILQLLSEAAN